MSVPSRPRLPRLLVPVCLSLCSPGPALAAAPVIDLAGWTAPSGDAAWNAERVVGLEVRGPDGDAIGEVEDVLVGADERVSALALELGGALDIGDVHVRLPWAGVASVDAVGSLQYLTLPEGEEAFGSRGTADDVVLEPGEWRARDLLGDSVVLVDSPDGERGTVDDLLFAPDGALEAIVASDVPGTDGTPADFPFYGYEYGFEPSLDRYILPYSVAEVADRAGRVEPDANGGSEDGGRSLVEGTNGNPSGTVEREPGTVTVVTGPVEVTTFDRPEAGGEGSKRAGPDASPDASPDADSGEGDESPAGAVRASLDAEALFEIDSSDPKLAAEQAIADLLVRLEGIPDIARIAVVGHTDSTGPAAYNLELSRQRAEAVAELIRADLPDVSVDAEGVGETEPQASNDTPEGRQLNRRVDVTAYRR